MNYVAFAGIHSTELGERSPLTVYSEGDVSFCDSDPRHDGLAGVRSGVLLGNSLQLQGVTIAEHLVGDPERQVRSVLAGKSEAAVERREGNKGIWGTFISVALIVEPGQM